MEDHHHNIPDGGAVDGGRTPYNARFPSSNPHSGDGTSPRKIFIGGLARETTPEQFVKHFGKYGEITDSVIMKDRMTGQPRGFGFVTYADSAVVDRVIEKTHVFHGKQVEIKRTVPRGAGTKDFKTNKIFVGGIPSTVNEDEFRDFFSKYGEVKEQQIMRDHSTGGSHGFGFVTFEAEQSVDDLLANGNRIEFAGAKVEIKKAELKKPNAPAAPSRRPLISSLSSSSHHFPSTTTTTFHHHSSTTPPLPPSPPPPFHHHATTTTPPTTSRPSTTASSSTWKRLAYNSLKLSDLTRASDSSRIYYNSIELPCQLNSISNNSVMKKSPNHHQKSIVNWWPALVATAVKLLLIPSYRSTDFEVHRNWLALTHSLHLSQWYFDTTSPWTLDYPPLFAYFEKILSFFASIVDPTMTHLQYGLNYASDRTIIFQRVSVSVSDLVLVYSVHRLTKNRNLGGLERFMMWVLVVWSPGLFIVDHLHFQYNGFLLGILLLSISLLEEGRDLLGGFVFAGLICFKHLFAVAGPVYFVYLLRHYCRGGVVKGFGKLVMMGSVVLLVFSETYGPFVYYGQMEQVFRRMFPFGRGLCHAYWAPNFWVFYIILDKFLAFFLVKLGFSIQAPNASFTGGLVGDSSPFAVLPTITPLITFIMVILAIFPCLIKAWRNPQPRMVSRWISYAYTCGFLFGWHVHEKASLHFVIPLAITALKSTQDAKNYFVLSIVSYYSLFPLLFEAQEYPIKVILMLLHALLMWFGFSSRFSERSTPSTLLKGTNTKLATPAFDFGCIGKCYLFGFFVVEIWGQFLHPAMFEDKLPFLPLMIISIYCAFGLMYSWIWQLKKITSIH